MRIGPNRPGFPMWISAMTSFGRSRCEYEMRHLSVLPSALVVALNVPVAPFTDDGNRAGLFFGVTTCPAAMAAARSCAAPADVAPDDVAAILTAAPTIPAITAAFFIYFSLLVP